MSLVGIAASTKDGIIGVNGAIPWHYKEDFAFFKFMTTGHAVVMGGNTYRSIGKPLPNRNNIVFTKKGGENKDNVKFINLVDECCCTQAIEHYMFDNEDIYIIGGGVIYDMFSTYIDRWIITYVEDQIELKKNDVVTKLNVDTISKTFKKLAEIKLSDKCKVVKYDKVY